jgi:hypothetical protein
LQRTICNQKPVMYDRFALACCALDSFMVTWGITSFAPLNCWQTYC